MNPIRVARAAACAFALLCAASIPAYAQSDSLLTTPGEGENAEVSEPISAAAMESMFPYSTAVEPEPAAAAMPQNAAFIEAQRRVRVRSTPAPDRDDVIIFGLLNRDPRKSHLNATFGGINNAGGFALGINLTTADAIDNVELYADATVSFFRFYRRLETGAIFGNLNEKGAKGFVRYRYTRRTQDNFYGLGPTSTIESQAVPTFPILIGGETNDEREERAVQGALWWSIVDEPTRRFQAGVYAELVSTGVFEGRDDADPSIFDIYRPYFSGIECLLPVFPQNAVPGLLGSRILTYGAFMEFDARNRYYGLPQGFYLYARVAGHDGMTSDEDRGGGPFGLDPYDFGWVQATIDARGYIPLFGPKTSLALRMFTDLNERKGGSAIPYYHMATLGGGTTLRGFNTFRFRGENALVFQAEIRRTVWEKEGQGIDIAFFGDAGQVWGFGFNRDCPPDLIGFDPTFGDDYDSDFYEVDFGAGIAYRLSEAFSLRIDYAHSNEGDRIRLGFSAGF
jgi:hypothetical protein